MLDPDCVQACSATPVFLLCGGLGSRYRRERDLPKPLAPIGDWPLLWHVMQCYSRHGFRRFVLCLGYMSDSIKEWFLDEVAANSDFTVEHKADTLTLKCGKRGLDWEVVLAFTGETAKTGSRLAQAAEQHLKHAECFAVSYGDGLTDANLTDELEFHRSHGRIGTVLGVHPRSQYGELSIDGTEVHKFAEKPCMDQRWINGGFFLFHREFLQYLSLDENCVLEAAPLEQLTSERQLRVFKHPGFWACMDTPHDQELLTQEWESGKARWAGRG